MRSLVSWFRDVNSFQNGNRPGGQDRPLKGGRSVILVGRATSFDRFLPMPITTNTEFVAFDLETTGLSPYFNRIVEIGAVRFRGDGTEIARFQQLVNPACHIPVEVAAVHGITDQMVQGQPTIADALPQFIRFIGASDTVLLAHNACFDLGFLSFTLTRCTMAIPEHPVVDTLALSRRRLWDLPNHKLETVARHFGVINPDAHRALADSLVVQSIFQKLLAIPPSINRLKGLFDLAPPYCIEPVEFEAPTVSRRHQPLIDAIEIGQCITIIYRGETRGMSRRQITPTNLIKIHGRAYVVAHCHRDNIEKHFRLDRIVEVVRI